MNTTRPFLDRAVCVSLAAASLVICVALERSAPESSGSDPFDSPGYWWTWVVLPVSVGLIAFMLGRRARPLLWTFALMAPLMMLTAVNGTAWHDPDRGASFWIVGEIFLAVEATVVLAGAALGRAAGRWVAHR